MPLNPNEMTPASDPKVIRDENKLEAKAKALRTKGVYRRLLDNPDFQEFYDYLEMCYNSYMTSGGSSQTPKETKDHLLGEAATIYKIQQYIKRQAN